MEHSFQDYETAPAFCRLLDLIRTLRSENGCPWDKKQTLHSFHPNILEEYHEMVHAINSGNLQEISEELGDLLFLVIFVGHMLEQQNTTSLADIMNMVTVKMTRRHPHVFGNTTVRDADDVIKKWSQIKATEEGIKDRESILDGIPRSLPALSRAQKLSSRAARVGFDWTRAEQVFEKIEEEFAEFKEAAASGIQNSVREEIGDLLFVLVNAGRHLGINCEAALAEASDKFERRFRYIETQLASTGRSASTSSLEEMDALWNEAKCKEKKCS
jgi:MazG family protein